MGEGVVVGDGVGVSVVRVVLVEVGEFVDDGVIVGVAV